MAGELWDMLSGESGTMQILLDIINRIAPPCFKQKYDYVNNVTNRLTEQYRTILNEWNLYSEVKILDNIDRLNTLSALHPSLKRLLKQNLFDKKGEYKATRATDILAYL